MNTSDTISPSSLSGKVPTETNQSGCVFYFISTSIGSKVKAWPRRSDTNETDICIFVCPCGFMVNLSRLLNVKGWRGIRRPVEVLLRFKSANHESVTCRDAAGKTRPFMLWHAAVGWERNRNEVKKKGKTDKEGEMRKPLRRRLAGWMHEGGREVWLRRRGVGEWNGKTERADGWERIGAKAAASCTRLLHSSYFSLRQAGGRVDRQRSKNNQQPLVDVKDNVFCKGLFQQWKVRRGLVMLADFGTCLFPSVHLHVIINH